MVSKLKNDEKSFWFNIGKLISGAILSQVIVFLSIPIITRLYSPDVFGVAAVFTSIVLSIAPLTSFSYHQAIMLPDSDKDALNLIALSLMIVMLFCLSLFIPFGVFGEQIALLFNTPMLEPFVWLIPIAVFSRGLWLVFVFQSSREKKFGLQAFSRISQTVTDRIFILGAGFIGYATSTSIIAGRLVASFFETGVFYGNVKTLYRNRLLISIKSMKKLAVTHKKFPLYASWVGFLSDTSAKLPIYMLAFFFSPEASGLYAMSNRLLQIPMQLLGNSIRRVYYQSASSDKNDIEELRRFFKKIREKLIGYGLFPFLVLFATGGGILPKILGDKWAAIDVYVKILCLLVSAQFISVPIAGLVNVLGEQKKFLKLIILSFIVRFLALFIGGMLENQEIALWLLAVAGVSLYIHMNCWIGKLINITIQDTVLFFLKHLGINSFFISILIGLRVFFPHTIFYQFTAFAVTTILYYIVAFYMIDDFFILSKWKKLFDFFIR